MQQISKKKRKRKEKPSTGLQSELAVEEEAAEMRETPDLN